MSTFKNQQIDFRAGVLQNTEALWTANTVTAVRGFIRKLN